MKMLETLLIAFAAAAAGMQHAHAESKVACAVLDFATHGEASEPEASAIADSVSVDLSRTGQFMMLPRYKTRETLKKNLFNPAAFRNEAEAAREAGRLLNASCIVMGSLSRKGEKNEASAMLYNARAMNILARADSASTGDAASFRTAASRSIAEKLAGRQPLKKEFIRSDSKITDSLEPLPTGIETQPAASPSPPIQPAGTADITEIKGGGITESISEQEAVHEERAHTASDSPQGPPSRTGQLAATVMDSARKAISAARDASSGRLDAGIRYRSHSLKKDTADSFLGSINTLDVDDEGIPAELFAAWHFSRCISAELSWFNLRARTLTNPEGFSDGAISVSGPTIAVCGEYPGLDPWTPFASIGLGLFSSEFQHEAWWHFGYQSVQEWRSQGSPSYSMNGKTRTMDLSGTSGLFFMLGIRFSAQNNWSFEAAYRTMSLEVDDHYTITVSGELIDDRETTFPLDNSSFMLGARYSFE